MEERVVFILKEFFEDIDKREPFPAQLMEFRLRFRAKLLEIVTSHRSSPELANRTLDYTLEAVERTIREEIERVNLESEAYLHRTIETLRVVGEVLKEFMHEDRVGDKRKLSSTSGFIGRTVERLGKEYRNRFGGFVKGIRRLFSIGKSP